MPVFLVLANIIAPFFMLAPGILPGTWWAAFPATLLAAVIERPFVERAGVRDQALWYSMQANFFSLMIGYALVPISRFFLFGYGPVLLVGAVGLSVWSEGKFYQWRALPAQRPLHWPALWWGNVTSSLFLMFLPPIALLIAERWSIPAVLWPYENVFNGSVLLICLAIFWFSFRATRAGSDANTPPSTGDSPAAPLVPALGQSGSGPLAESSPASSPPPASPGCSG
jgi:hypothetical protein